MTLHEHEIVNRLKTLRETMEREGETNIREIRAPLNYALLDVCDALGLSLAQQNQVLGYDVQTAAEAERVWYPVASAA